MSETPRTARNLRHVLDMRKVSMVTEGAHGGAAGPASDRDSDRDDAVAPRMPSGSRPAFLFRGGFDLYEGDEEYLSL